MLNNPLFGKNTPTVGKKTPLDKNVHSTIAHNIKNRPKRKLAPLDFKCYNPQLSLTIDLRGYCYVCQCAAFLPYPVGHITDFSTMEEIWTNDVARKLQASTEKGSTFKFCSIGDCGPVKEEDVWFIYEDNGKIVDGPELGREGIGRTKIWQPNDYKYMYWINLAIDDSCNLQCPSCRIGMIHVNKGTVYEERHAWNNHFLELLSNFEQPAMIEIGGDGEVFSSKIYSDMMYNYKPYVNHFFTIRSNGTLINPKILDSHIMKKLIRFTISIDAGSEEVYNKVRYPGNWNTLIKNLDYLFDNGIKFTLNFVLQKDNIDDVFNYMELCHHYDTLGIIDAVRNWGTWDYDTFLKQRVHMPGDDLYEHWTDMKEKMLKHPYVNHIALCANETDERNRFLPERLQEYYPFMKTEMQKDLFTDVFPVDAYYMENRYPQYAPSNKNDRLYVANKVTKPKDKPKTLCMAPWVHTYLSPQTERRLCCASREPAQNFKQYIDTKEGSGTYNPLTLDEHWNSKHMKRIRRAHMLGEYIKECDVCNHKLLNTDVYRDYFWHLFKHKYDDIWETTDGSGHTTMKPISWDYRYSNLCNFKCRMCGDMLSSSWETEERNNDMINLDNPKNNWMRPDVRQQISDFQSSVVEKEFEEAVNEHRVEEVYWVGGEPLMFEQHWRNMKQLIEQGDGDKIYARYNTNLSRIQYKGQNLYTDILNNIRDWQICASIDGTGPIGEYIRDGLDYNKFLEYYKLGMTHETHPYQMRLDFTLTLPGLYEVKNMFDLTKELNTMLLSKVTFAFTPDIIMSPLCLPRDLLNSFIDELLEYCVNSTWKQRSIVDLLKSLKDRPNFEEQFPDEYEEGLKRGKEQLLKIEKIRNDSFTLEDILKDQLLTWWRNI